MEIAARRLAEALPGETIESVLTPGLNVLKTFDPPLSALDGARFSDVRRRGKLLLLEAATESHGPLTVLVHLMSAGRLMVYDKRGPLRDQQVIAGIGRTWVDEILHVAKLSPFKRGDDLSGREAEALREAMVGELERVLD